MNLIFRMRGSALCVALVLAAGSLCTAQSKAAPDVPKVVARVNGKELTRDQLAELAINMYGPQVLQRLIQQEIVRQEAGKQGVSVSKEEVDAFTNERIEEQIESLAKQLGLKKADNYDEQLKKLGTSLDRLRKGARERLEPHVWFELVSRKLVRRTIAVTDEDVRAEFARTYGPKIKVRQVVLPSRKEAEDVLKKLQMGADFSKLAKERSIDRLSRRRGGEVPPVPADSDIGKAVADLKPLGVSAIAEISNRFHIFQLMERVKARAAEFGKEKDRLREALIARRVRDRGRAWLQELTTESKIEQFM